MIMHRAFNAKMLTKMTRRQVQEGTYDDNNNWVEGGFVDSRIWGVFKAGNKFSQFEEGEALHPEDGGERHSDYRTLYITDKFTLTMGDKVIFKGATYNVLQRSDETPYGFLSYIVEKSKERE